jgi:hypothetical protein
LHEGLFIQILVGHASLVAGGTVLHGSVHKLCEAVEFFVWEKILKQQKAVGIEAINFGLAQAGRCSHSKIPWP